MTHVVPNAIAQLQQLIGEADAMMGFTGAGISTESGVPDFRSPNSPWRTHRPIPFDSFMASEAARKEAWRRKFAMDDLYAGARPNRGHAAFASLVASNKMMAVVTQNIDGLHQASGIPADRIVELHGNGTYARCLGCGQRHDLGPIRKTLETTGTPPVCASCGGILKSATISFGQPMPADAMTRAYALAERCDLILVVGSSLVVYPAAAVPVLAKRQGATLVILNREPTPLDDLADLVIHADIGTTLEPLQN